MHFFYIDEAGCTGLDLENEQQPVFTAGGIVVRDEGWNKTKELFEELIRKYFEGKVPANFELHACELLSPKGEGVFAGHERARRNKLAHDVLGLVRDRKHQTIYLSINKSKLKERVAKQIRTKLYWPNRAPYILAYDYLISVCEWFSKERLGKSARGMVIIDTKDAYGDAIASITQYRRVNAPTAQRVKWLTEFTYAIDSRKNPMVQISDLVCFVTKKFLEVDAGFHEEWRPAAKSAFRDFYSMVHDRLILKAQHEETGRYSNEYNDFISDIGLWPTRGFRAKKYA